MGDEVSHIQLREFTLYDDWQTIGQRILNEIPHEVAYGDYVIKVLPYDFGRAVEAQYVIKVRVQESGLRIFSIPDEEAALIILESQEPKKCTVRLWLNKAFKENDFVKLQLIRWWDSAMAQLSQRSGEQLASEQLASEQADETGRESLDLTDREILEAIPKLRGNVPRLTNHLIALRISPNPNTGEPYHDVTISRRRGRLADLGYDVDLG